MVVWIKIRNHITEGHAVVGVHGRLSDQEQPIDEAFLFQFQELSCSRALILVGDF